MLRRIAGSQFFISSIVRTFATQIKNEAEDKIAEILVPDKNAVADLAKIQAKQIEQLKTRYKNMLVGKVNRIGYVASYQAPESARESGGLLKGFAPSFTLPSSDVFSLSVLPQVPCLFLPKSENLNPIYLYAVPMNGDEYIWPNSSYAEVVTSTLAFKNGWLARQIKSITSYKIKLGPLAGFYDSKCEIEGEYFNQYKKNELQMPPPAVAVTKDIKEMEKQPPAVAVTKDIKEMEKQPPAVAVTTNTKEMEEQLRVPASTVVIPHTLFSKEMLNKVEDHYARTRLAPK